MPVPVCGPGQPGRLAMLFHRITSQIGHRTSKTNPDVRLERQEKKPAGENPVSPARLPDFHSATIGDYVADLVRKGSFEIVLIEYVSLAWIAEWIRQGNPAVRTIVDTHDVMHLRQRESVKLEIPFWLEITEQEEREALSKCDAVLAISPADKDVFQKMLPSKKVLLATWSTETVPRKRTGNDRPFSPVNIGFIGSEGHANRLGLNWFLRHCWPIICRECPENAILQIAGPWSADRDRDPRGFESDSRIQWIGQVSDVGIFYDRIQIAINPALLMSGFKIKSLEALSHGVPLVATTAGLAGLMETVGRGSFLADTAEEFARHVVALIRDPLARSTASEEAIALVRQRYTPDTVYRELETWIRSER